MSLITVRPDIKRLAEAKKYGTVIRDRYAGDGINAHSLGGGMVLAKCDWCGALYNFRRGGSRICTPCWKARGGAHE